MKCPFRLKKVIESILNGAIKKTIIETQFEECIGEECPYFQIKRVCTYPGDSYTIPACRKVDANNG